MQLTSTIFDMLHLLLLNGVDLLVELAGAEGLGGGKEEEVKSTHLFA